MMDKGEFLKRFGFLTGFFGWFVIFTVVWLFFIATSPPGPDALLLFIPCFFIVLVLNLGSILFLLSRQMDVASGVLTAMVVNVCATSLVYYYTFTPSIHQAYPTFGEAMGIGIMGSIVGIPFYLSPSLLL